MQIKTQPQPAIKDGAEHPRCRRALSREPSVSASLQRNSRFQRGSGAFACGGCKAPAVMMTPRLPLEELFRIGPKGLEELSDATLEMRISESEQRRLARQSDPGYRAAVAEELLQKPEAI